MSEFQKLSTQEESIPQYIFKFIISIFKVSVHGIVAFCGFIFLFLYIVTLGINLQYGNYIVFIPLLMVLLVPFTIIIVGAMNSYSVRYIYCRKTDDSWLSLLIEGIFVIFIESAFSIAWTILIVYFFSPTWPPFYLNFGWLFILFYSLVITSTGFIMKELTISLFTRTKASQE